MLKHKKSIESHDYGLPENCEFNRYDLGWLLNWSNPVNKILIVRKEISISSLENAFIDMCSWIVNKTTTELYVESKHYDAIVSSMSCEGDINNLKCRIHSFMEFVAIDLIITIGGDGTLMKAAAYFRGICPPILAYNMGTLGFLAPFNFELFQESLPRALSGNVPCILRNRLSFSVPLTYNENQEISNQINSNKSLVTNNGDGQDEDDNSAEYVALNEVVIDRGYSSHLLSLLVEVNGSLITKITGDGLIVSTPTGSTAYSMSTGASIIHPTVRGVFLAPINPFSLSMRPIFLPVGVEITIRLDPEARCDKAHVSFDGNQKQWSLNKTDRQCVIIAVSRFPVISICKKDQMTDWFQGLSTGLNWNKLNKSRTDSES